MTTSPDYAAAHALPEQRHIPPEERHWLEDLMGKLLHDAKVHEAAAMVPGCPCRSMELYEAALSRARAGNLAKQLGIAA